MKNLQLIDENITTTFEYYNISKAFYEETLNYLNSYKTQTEQYCQNMKTLNKDFDNKLLKCKIESNTKINTVGIIQSNKIIPELIKQHISNYSNLFEIMEIFIKDFHTLIDEKNVLIKNQLEQYNDKKKDLMKHYQDIDNCRKIFESNINLTEDYINEYLTQKNIIPESKDNNNKQINNNIEQIKKLEEKMNNSIKETKNFENNYITSIGNIKLYQYNYKEMSNQTIDVIKSSLYELSKKYTDGIFGLLGLFRVPFQLPLQDLNLHIEQISKKKVKENRNIDDLLDNLYNKNIGTLNVLPTKYKLKTIKRLNMDDENIFSMENFENNNNEIKTNEEKIDELSEIDLSLIKTMYDNFSLLSNHKIDIKLEEEKFYMKNLVKKLFKNIESYNKGENDILFAEKDIIELEKLIEKNHNGVIFLKELNNFRTLSKFKLTTEHYKIIGNIFLKILTKFDEDKDKDKDYKIPKNCIILSQTYYYLHEEQKIYLKTFIQEHRIFKDFNFWENLITFLMDKEMERKTNMPKKNYSNVAFGVLYTMSDIMIEFDLSEENINKILESKIEKYKIDETFKNEINKLVSTNIANRKKKISERKNSIRVLKKILGDKNNIINENKDKEDNDKNKEEDKKIETAKDEKKNIWEINDE